MFIEQFTFDTRQIQSKMTKNVKHKLGEWNSALSILIFVAILSPSFAAIQYPATIKTKGGQHSGSATVDLKNIQNYDTIFFTFDVTVVMGSNTKITISGSTANGDGFISNNEQRPGEKFIRAITQRVTKSRDGGGTHLSIFLQTVLKLSGGKEKYGNTTVGVRIASGLQAAHYWDIRHAYNNNYEDAEEGGICLGCEIDEEEEQIDSGGYVPCVTQGVPTQKPGNAIGTAPLYGPASVQCKSRELAPNQLQFTCEGADPNKITLSSEHILWLCSAESQNQRLDIVVPNYQVEELIRGALKGSMGASTTVNILLKQPEKVYDVQAQDSEAIPAGMPTVNLQYEEVKDRTSVHYPVDQSYNPLQATIREP